MMKTLTLTLRTSLALILLVVVYQLVVTGIAQAFMPGKADGSLVYDANHQLIGSELIGQSFTSPALFHGRISSIDYNAASSGTPNYAPSNLEMIQRTEEAVRAWEKENPQVPVSKLPIDLVTNSGSGLDPDISVAAAEVQIPRVSANTGIPADQLQELVDQHTKGRELGLFSEPVVNVLLLNLDVQQAAAGK
ncbi:potassium-transporting ATPase subunit KdpC [Paenibacillus yonginensis]|nr:potassium-transporting ATPase subunit KdpC [Paenibacillus yonginensis]